MRPNRSRVDEYRPVRSWYLTGLEPKLLWFRLPLSPNRLIRSRILKYRKGRPHLNVVLGYFKWALHLCHTIWEMLATC